MPFASSVPAATFDFMPAKSALTPDVPWPGPAPYGTADRAFFHGRKRETEELLRLIQRDEDDWLGHYGTDEGLDGVFQRVALRHHGFSPIKDAVLDLQANRAAFEAGFDEFFPDLIAWVGKLGPEADTLI